MATDYNAQPFLSTSFCPLGSDLANGKIRIPAGAGMPTTSQTERAASAMHLAKPQAPLAGNGVFTDREGVGISWDEDSARMKPPAWAPVLLEIMQGHIIVDRAPEVGGEEPLIYRRDDDPTASGHRLDSWHVVNDLQVEMGIRPHDRMRALDRWVAAIAGQSEVKMLHAVRVRHRDGWTLWRREADGMVHEYSSKTAPASLVESPAEITISTGATAYSLDELVEQAARVIEWMTADEDSRFNFARLFAAPALDPIGILSFVLFGEGRNGKSLLFKAMSQHLDTAREADVSLLTAGGYDAGDQILALRGALWALMDEAPAVDYDREPILKKLGSHSVVRGRVIGQTAVAFRARATLVYGTNEPPIDSPNASYSRRYAVVRMQDGHADAEFEPLVAWLTEGPGVAALMAYSARHWGGITGPVDPAAVPPTGLVGPGTDTTHRLVTITDARSADDSIDELACAIVDAIRRSAGQDDPEGWGGFVPSTTISDMAKSLVGPTWRQARRQALQMVGCESTRRRTRDSTGSYVVYCIARAKDAASIARWEAWTKRADAEAAEAPEIVTTGASDAAVPAPPMPITTPDVKAPDEAGFHARFVPGGRDKAVIGWQKRNAFDTAEAALDAACAAGGSVYAVNPAEGYCIVDLDVNKDGREDGWTAICHILGGAPATYTTRTPSGGVHLYYRCPEGFTPKNCAGVGSTAIDVRTHRGYVIGPVSETAAGSYVVADDRDVAEMPQQLVAWLRENGAEEGAPAPRKPRAPRPAKRPTGPLAALESIFAPSSGGRPTGPVSSWRVPAPDVTPGSTHDDLRDWIFAWVGYAAEANATTDETDAVVRQLLALAAPYATRPGDDRDTELLIRGALDRFGIDSTEI